MLRQTVPRSDPQQLGLVRIELETISGHPLTDICDAAFETISCRRNVVATAVQVHLCAVSERADDCLLQFRQKTGRYLKIY